MTAAASSTPSTRAQDVQKPLVVLRPTRPLRRAATSDLTLDEIALRLPLRQRQVFGVLRRSINGRFLQGWKIVQLVGDDMARGSMSNCYTSLKRRLEGTLWNIEVQYGAGGGYRMVMRS